MKTPTTMAIECIQGHVAAGESLPDAARRFACEHPAMRLRVLDVIGSWPSSEPELRALQRAAP